MKRTSCVLLLFLLVGLAHGGWEPPTDGNTYKVLGEARQDAAAGQYADALTKQVWVWEHEQVSRRGFKDFRTIIGTRISAAGLIDWVKLGTVFPPALQRIKAIREQAQQRVQSLVAAQGSDWFQALVDFVSVNMALNDYSRTRELFFWLDANNPKAAKLAFESLEPIEALLIHAGDYRLWSKYEDPARFVRHKSKFYQADEKSPLETHFGKTQRQNGEKYFCNRMAMLVCLLAQNAHQPDAQRIAAEALQECDTPGFRALLDGAKAGRMPAPWWPWGAATGN